MCETCGAGPVEKVLFPVAVHFKGSGFYATDYGRGSRKSSAKDGDSGSTSTDGGSVGVGQAGRDGRGEEVGLLEVRRVRLSSRQGIPERTAARAAAEAARTDP